MTKVRAIAAMTGGVVAIVLATLTAEAGRANSPAFSGRIAFTSNSNAVPGNAFDIYTINADGSDLERLTNALGTDFWPSWSPDGSQIAFRSRRDANSEIYVMNADGSTPVRLTNHPATDDQPAWSRDGTRIAFVSLRDGNSEIYAMNADGSGVERLTGDPSADLAPRWSPDGDRILFTSTRSGHAAVYKMKLDGSKVEKLTDDGLEGAQADWSTVGNHITLVDELCPTCGESDVLVMKHTGKELTQVTDTPENETVPRWSPDGAWIAFERGPFDLSRVDIWVMRSDGSGAVNLTNTNTPFVFNLIPDWAPTSG